VIQLVFKLFIYSKGNKSGGGKLTEVSSFRIHLFNILVKNNKKYENILDYNFTGIHQRPVVKVATPAAN